MYCDLMTSLFIWCITASTSIQLSLHAGNHLSVKQLGVGVKFANQVAQPLLS